METIKHDQWSSNSEWLMLGYSYHVESVTSMLNKKHFSTLHISFTLRRNDAYYFFTMFIPILVLTLLSPLGLILPVDSGEKIGLQITILLTMVIYVETLQNSIPVFDSYGNSPLMLTYFIITICVICFCLLISTHTLILHHVHSYESNNFSKTEATFALGMTRFLNAICCGMWVIEPPSTVVQIAQHSSDDLHVKFDHEQLLEGYQFYAEMINRLMFVLVVVVQCIALFATIIPAWVTQH